MLCLLVVPSVSGTVTAPENSSPPSIDHILLEVKDLDRSIKFYRHHLGLKLKNRSGDFVTMEAANVGIYLWASHWKWSPAPNDARPPQGMYPHLAVPDTKKLLGDLKKDGFRILDEGKDYNYGTEGFVAD